MFALNLDENCLCFIISWRLHEVLPRTSNWLRGLSSWLVVFETEVIIVTLWCVTPYWSVCLITGGQHALPRISQLDSVCWLCLIVAHWLWTSRTLQGVRGCINSNLICEGWCLFDNTVRYTCIAFRGFCKRNNYALSNFPLMSRK
jgi:hypothetical protein